MATETFANALRRVGGMWGAAYNGEGKMLTDVVAVTATRQRAKIDIPLVGQQTTGSKPGRVSNDASIAFQKVDTAWEAMVFRAMTLDVDELRAARDAGQYGQLDGKFNLQLKHDDPHAFGKEVWQLTGCMIWQMDIGINIAEDFIQREIPMSFDDATLMEGFQVKNGVVTKLATIGSAAPIPQITP